MDTLSPLRCLFGGGRWLWTAPLLVLLFGLLLWLGLDWAARRDFERAIVRARGAGLAVAPADLTGFGEAEPPNPYARLASRWASHPAKQDLEALLRPRGDAPRAAGRDVQSVGESDALAKLARADDVLASLHDLAAQPTPAWPAITSLLECRDLANLAVARARERANRDDFEGALADLRALFRMTRSMGTSPYLITQMIRVACVAIGLEALEDLLPLFPSARAALVAADIDPCLGAAHDGLRGEGLLLAQAFTSGVVDAALPGSWPTVLRPYGTASLAHSLRTLTTLYELTSKPLRDGMREACALDHALTAERQGWLGALRPFCLVPSGVAILQGEGRIASLLEMLDWAAGILDGEGAGVRLTPELAERYPSPTESASGRRFLVTWTDESVLIKSPSLCKVELSVPRDR